MQPLMPPIDSSDKLFHDGNPLTGEKGTIVTADFLNNAQGAIRDQQSELIAVLTAAGISPDKAKTGQLLSSLQKLFPDAKSFGVLLSASGYQKLPGGLIMQWGTLTGSVGQLAGIYPMAFPNGVFQACAVLADKTAGAVAGITLYSEASGANSKTTLTVQPRGTDGNGTTTARFIAFGW